MKLDEGQVLARARFLYNKVNGAEGVMIRNMARYENNGVRRKSLWEPNIASLLWQPGAKGANGVQTQLNVIKSAVDTLTSKVSEAAVRPYFNSISGDFDTHQLITQMQNYFDVWLDEQHAIPKSTLCFRDACLFSHGVMYVDPESQSLSRIEPWMYSINPGEYDSKTITEVGLNFGRYVPLAKFKDTLTNKKLKKRLDDDPHCYGKYDIYWDLYHGFKYELFDSEFITDPLPLDYEQYGGLYRRPFVEIWYSQPTNGYFPPSLADDLYTIQREVDAIVQRMDVATRNAVIGMVLLPQGAGFKASNIENGYNIYPYQPSVDGNRPEVVTPAPMASEWVIILKQYIEWAYELAGISQISAASKIPSNVESGKMLDSIENAESERFNQQLQQFTHFLIDCSRVAIDCFPKLTPIIDKKMTGDKLTWGQVRQKRDLYEIQFTPASILSKNPEEKINQINTLIQNHLLDSTMVADLMQIPDLEKAETLASSAYHYCERIFKNAVMDEDYDYYEGVDLNLLLKVTTKQLNVMLANGDKDEYIKRGKTLQEKILKDVQGMAVLNKPPPAAPPPTPFEPLRDFNYSGDQTKALKDIVVDVRDGQLPVGSGIALATIAYPKIPPQLLNSLFTSLQTQPVNPIGQGSDSIAAAANTPPQNNAINTPQGTS